VGFCNFVAFLRTNWNILFRVYIKNVLEARDVDLDVVILMLII
jgi:hypothetical protein